MSTSPRMVNAVFAFPMNPQQCIARRPTEMDANNAGGGFQPVPGRSEVMVSSPSSRKEQDRNGATAVTSMTVGLSGRLKRHLCDGRVVGDKEQGGPTANKRHKQRGTRGTRVSGVVAVAAAKTAAVMDSNNSYSPAPLRSHIAPQLQAPQYPHLYQHQHQHQRVLAPVQKTVTPCQAISATGRHGEDMWGNWNRAGGEKDSWDKRPSSPSMTLWRLDEGGSSSPSLSSPLDGTVEFTTVGKEMEEETDTTSRRLRPQQGLCLASRWSGVNSSGKKMNSVSSMGSTTNTATSFAAATGELKGEQQQQKQLKRPAKDFLPYAEESLNAALLDEQNKRLVWEASKPAEGAAQLRRVMATASKGHANERLKVCWWQSLQPAYQEAERFAGSWADRFNDLSLAQESARRTRDIERNVEDLFRQARDRVLRAMIAHEKALSELTFPAIDCDYGELLAVEKATRDAEYFTRCSVENVRRKLEEVRAAVKLAAEHVDIESFKRLFLAEEVSAAKRCYGEARNNFGNLRAQLKVAVAEERAARVAERIAIEPRNQYNAAMLRSKRARDTFDLFVASRGTGSEDPTAATTTEGGGIVTTSADAGGADASGAAPSAAAGSIAVAGRGRPRGGAGRGERMSVKEEFPLKNPSAFGTKKL